MKVKIINLKDKLPYDFYLGRKNKTYGVDASPLANPYTVKRESDRENALAQYKDWLIGRILDPMSDQYELLDEITEFLRKNYEVTLGCFCAPKRCHCEVVANNLNTRIKALAVNDLERQGCTVEYVSPQTGKKSRYKIKQNPLDDLWTEMYNSETCEGCEKCELSRSRTHMVWSRGNGAKRILIVGEAPGESEDEVGLPFVGASGKMLERMLNSVGLESQRDCWIVNACKCRPPNNRTPTAKETDDCFPYLQAQIVELMPAVILALGDTSTKRLIGKSDFKITNCRGKLYPLDLSKWHLPSVAEDSRVSQLESILVLPTFHPSYLLRNPQKTVASVKWYAWQDMQKLRSLTQEL